MDVNNIYKNNNLTFTIKGGDGHGWALDQTLEYVKDSLEAYTSWRNVKSIKFADIVIFPWYPGFKEFEFLISKKQIVVCFLDNDSEKVYPFLSKKKHKENIDIWLTHSSKEKEKLRRYGYEAYILPSSPKNKIKENKNIDKYFSNKLLDSLKKFKKFSNKKLILSIQRDSSFINGSWLPKDQKNPQYLLDLYKKSFENKLPYILVLTGTRRHWIVKKLDEQKLPYLFLGEKPIYKDDYWNNKIPREIISKLIRECDYSIITSSWEGGPLCIRESLDENIPVFSTPVGNSSDLLSEELILSGVLNNDINLINGIITSNSKTSFLLNESIKKYSKFVDQDTNNIIFSIIEINKLKQIKSKFIRNLIVFDTFFEKVELLLSKIIRRLKIYLSR